MARPLAALYSVRLGKHLRAKGAGGPAACRDGKSATRSGVNAGRAGERSLRPPYAAYQAANMLITTKFTMSMKKPQTMGTTTNAR